MTFITNYLKILLQITAPSLQTMINKLLQITGAFLQTTTESYYYYYYSFTTNYGQKILRIKTKIY